MKQDSNDDGNGTTCRTKVLGELQQIRINGGKGPARFYQRKIVVLIRVILIPEYTP